MGNPGALRRFDITKIESSRANAVAGDDVLAVEEPLEIRVGGRSVAVVMRTPGHDRELAAGFLVTEGIVRRREDVLDMVPCREGTRRAASDVKAEPDDARWENVLDVILAPGASVDLARLTRHVFTSSSCGVCGKATIDAVRGQFAPITPADMGAPAARVRAAVLATLPAKLRAAQPGFDATGGLHASALFTGDGEVVFVREDVGRHNALDKVVGAAFFAERLPLAGTVLLVSGRVSFELMQKALAAGIPCVAAISAPTSLAVEFARESGQTLVGFLRDGRMNVYAGTLADA